MPTSASNHLRGRITNIVEDEVMAQVDLELSNGEKIRALISTDSVKRLGLKVGMSANAVIKATSVMIETE